jgi:hypothetical protein
MPSIAGRFSIGTAAPIIVHAPFDKPDPPIPATARPIMSMAEERAAPHRTEPSSKTARKHKNEYYES